MKTKISGWFIVIAFLVSCMAACDPDDDDAKRGTNDDPLEAQPVITTTISGVVTDEQGKPVSDAEITVQGETTYTDEMGAFLLSAIEVPGNRAVVMATKAGYFPATRAHKPEENSKTDVRLVMMASAVTHNFDAGAGISANVEGSVVTIEANSLVDESGESYSGSVSMSLRYLDPTAGNFGVLVPGGDMVAVREDESTSILYSYGILRVTMKGQGNETLQLAPGTTSTLTMSIPQDQLATAPETIPLWYFDEDKGVWVEDGSATKEGDKYVGTVTHFTDWNCDAPTDGATIIGRLLDCDGNPAWGVVEFGQIATDPQSSTESDQSDGRFSRRVPDGVELTVVISDPLMVTPLTKNGRGKVIVVVPPLSPGQVYNVGDIQTFPCAVDVKGSFNLKDGDQIYGLYFMGDYGIKEILDPGESFAVTLPPNGSFTMYVNTALTGSHPITVNTPGEGESLDLGVIDLTGDNSPTGQEVTITGRSLCFGDPETQGQISVSWQDESGWKINYTSPDANGNFGIQAPPNSTVMLSSSTQHGTWDRTVETGAPSSTLDLGTFEICDNTNLGETAFQINGDNYSNETISIVQNSNISQLNGAIYYESSDMTFAYATDTSTYALLAITFFGQEPGQRLDESGTAISIRIQRGEQETLYWTDNTLEGSSLQMNITKYGEVGDVIEGTFSGTFLVSRDGDFTGGSVTITNGKFSVVRRANAP
jgi:hypothetical protein